MTTATDDRVPAEISYAATNLVKPDLASRRKSDDAPAPAPAPKDKDTASLKGERQASFPPTPPPENEFAPSKPIRANTVAGMGGSDRMGAGSSVGGRSMSVREREREREGAARREQSRDGRERLDPGYGPRRPGPALEQPRRTYSARGGGGGAAPAAAAARSRSVREVQSPPQQHQHHQQHQREQSRRRNDRSDRPDRPEYTDEAEGNPYSDELYDLYGGGAAERREPSAPPSRRGAGSVRRRPSRRAAAPQYYEDEDEYPSDDDYQGSSFDEDDFEMLDSRSAARGQSRRPDVKKVCMQLVIGLGRGAHADGRLDQNQSTWRGHSDDHNHDRGRLCGICEAAARQVWVQQEHPMQDPGRGRGWHD